MVVVEISWSRVPIMIIKIRLFTLQSRRYLSVPATSTTAERAMSRMGFCTWGWKIYQDDVFIWCLECPIILKLSKSAVKCSKSYVFHTIYPTTICFPSSVYIILLSDYADFSDGFTVCGFRELLKHYWFQTLRMERIFYNLLTSELPSPHCLQSFISFS